MLLKDEWLSLYFKEAVYSYQQSDLEDLKDIQSGFVYTKIPTEDQIQFDNLIKDGFELVETSLLFEQKKKVIYPLVSSFDIGFVKKEEESDVRILAKNSFLSSRFYQDEHIPKSTADKIKEDWVANYFRGKRGDNMVVARYQDKVVGFLLLINQQTIDLIAVSPDYRRMGVAFLLIGFTNAKIGLLRAGTQSNNLSSIAMYKKSGFSLKKSFYVMHKFFGYMNYE